MTQRPLRAVGLTLVLSALARPVVAQTGRFDPEKTKTGLIEKALKERGVPSISIALVKATATALMQLVEQGKFSLVLDQRDRGGRPDLDRYHRPNAGRQTP